MHTSSLAAPQMETSLESKFSAAFEQQIAAAAVGNLSKSQLCNGSNLLLNSRSRSIVPSSIGGVGGAPNTTTATPNTESTSGEKTVSFRKGNDLESFESLSSLFANGLFTDLVICCPGKMFKCHRVVMAAASLYIRDALSAFYNNNTDNNGGSAGIGSGGNGSGGCNNCNTIMILPTEIKMTDMEAILRFIYDGHVEVKVDSIESFLRSARTLNIKGLSNVNIVFNNNGTTTTTNSNDDGSMSDIEVISTPPTSTHIKNNGYTANKNHNSQLLNGHAVGINSPPLSPPPSSQLPSGSSSLNSSLASLKAMTANQTSLSQIPNGNAHHTIAQKFLNGSMSNHLLNQYRNNLKSRDQSPLRHQDSSSINIQPAHQSSTPKSIFNNGTLFNNTANNNSNNSNTTAANNVRFDPNSSSSGGSRRKQKFPTNIPFIPEMLSPAATAIYQTWLNMTSEDDDDDDIDEMDDDKRLIIKDDSSNDCGSTIGDNLSTTSVDSKQQTPLAPFGAIQPPFAPQMPPCMIEVEADPTTFPTFSDFNESSPLPPSTTTHHKRRRHFKSPFLSENNRINEKRMKLPFNAGANSNNTNSNNSLDVSIKPSSPLIHPSNSNNSQQSQQSSPTELCLTTSKKQSNNSGSGGGASTRSSSAGLSTSDKPLFTAYSNTIKTAAGANPSASSPSSSTSSASASGGSWVGSKWKCDICNKYYGNKQTLKEHIDYFHSNREEQIYICNICNKEYTWRKSLMKHYRDIHQMRNTPALAEINRQLAALASSAKVRSAVANAPGTSPGITPTSGLIGTPGIGGDNPLQSYVSIANFTNNQRKSSTPHGGSKGSSDNSEKSNRSESEMDNDNTNDGLATGDCEDDYGNDDCEMEGASCTTDADMPDETSSTNNDSESVKLSNETESKASETTKSNGEQQKSNQNSENTTTEVDSPASSHGSS